MARLEVSGDEPLAQEIEQKIMSRNGLGDNSETCEQTVITVAKTSAGIRLVMMDSGGTHRTRTVSGFDGAVAIVESWMDKSLTEDLLIPSVDAKKNLREAAQRDGARDFNDDENPFLDKDDEQEAQQPEEDAELGIWATARVEVSGGFDGTVWMGAVLGGCKRLRFMCLGVAARYGYDFHTIGASARYITRRNGFDALVTLDFPFEWKILMIWPGLGLGVGWLWAVREEYFHGPDIFMETDVGGRADIHLSIIAKLPKGFAIELGGTLGWSFFGHTGTATRDELTYVVNPVGFGRGSLAISYGW